MSKLIKQKVCAELIKEVEFLKSEIVEYENIQLRMQDDKEILAQKHRDCDVENKLIQQRIENKNIQIQNLNEEIRKLKLSLKIQERMNLSRKEMFNQAIHLLKKYNKYIDTIPLIANLSEDIVDVEIKGTCDIKHNAQCKDMYLDYKRLCDTLSVEGLQECIIRRIKYAMNCTKGGCIDWGHYQAIANAYDDLEHLKGVKQKDKKIVKQTLKIFPFKKKFGKNAEYNNILTNLKKREGGPYLIYAFKSSGDILVRIIGKNQRAEGESKDFITSLNIAVSNLNQ